MSLWLATSSQPCKDSLSEPRYREKYLDGYGARFAPQGAASMHGEGVCELSTYALLLRASWLVRSIDCSTRSVTLFQVRFILVKVHRCTSSALINCEK